MENVRNESDVNYALYLLLYTTLTYYGHVYRSSNDMFVVAGFAIVRPLFGLFLHVLDDYRTVGEHLVSFVQRFASGQPLVVWNAQISKRKRRIMEHENDDTTGYSGSLTNHLIRAIHFKGYPSTKTRLTGKHFVNSRRQFDCRPCDNTGNGVKRKLILKRGSYRVENVVSLV